jgi:hypothetical protein
MFATESREPILVKSECPVRKLDLFKIVNQGQNCFHEAKIIYKDPDVTVFLDQKGESLSIFTHKAHRHTITCTAEDAKVDGVLNLSTMKYIRNKKDFKDVLKPVELSDTVEVYFNKDGDSELFDMKVIFTNEDKIVGVVSDLQDTIVEFSKSNRSECCGFELEGETQYRSK